MELVFRSMLLEDIETICMIEKEAFPTPWTAEAFYNELVNNHFAHYLVLEIDGEITGYAGMWTIMDEAHITNIAIRKPFQGKKLGEQLLGRLQEAAVKIGILRMTLEVRVSNKMAQRLYEKMGFYPVGTRKGYYSDDHEDALIMWANLNSKEI
jgi:ribosomal-protein-alanine N-acetyltransferase